MPHERRCGGSKIQSFNHATFRPFKRSDRLHAPFRPLRNQDGLANTRRRGFCCLFGNTNKSKTKGGPRKGSALGAPH